MVATVSVASAASLGFTDDSSIPSWAEPAIEGLMDLGVLSGNDDGSFAPNRQLNRAEVAKIIVLATGIPFDTAGGPHFPDVEPGEWYYDYIETMYNYGWINGYPDGMFRPGVGINRAEIAKMVVNAFEFPADTTGAPHFSDVTSADWFYSYVETAYNYQLMDGFGDGTFGPALPVTRAETAAIVWNAFLQWSVPVGPVAGTLEVMLSADTPRGTNIPFNAVSVPYTTVAFTAADDASIDIGSLTFTRLGLGDADAFDKCWFEVEGFKISKEASVSTDDITTVRFNPAMLVPAGTTVTGDLVCSMDDAQAVNVQGAPDNAGQSSRFAIVSPDDIVSSATSVVGAFPVDGEEMRIAEYAVSEVEFNCLGADTIVSVGTSFVEIGKFKLLNDSATNKDVLLRAVTFKNDGTADLEDVLANAALYVSGEQVSVESIVDGDYLSFLLDDGVTGGLVLEDGDSIIFSIRGDLISAEQGDTIKFELDNAEDMVGIEIGTSFGVRVVDSEGRLAEDSRASCSVYTLDAGDLTLSRDPSSLGNQEYAPGSDDAVGQTCRIVAQQPIVADGITICVADGSKVADKDGNGTANELADFNAAFSNYRLYIDDTLVDSEDKLAAIGSGSGVEAFCLDFNTTFEVTGTSTMKLVMNIDDKADTNDQIKFKANADDFESPEYITTGDRLAEDQTVGICTGSFVEVQESKITLAKSDPNNNGDSFVAGADGLNVLSFTSTLNDSGDAVVTSVTVEAVASGSACQLENITGAFFVNGTQVGSPQSFDTISGSSTGNGTCIGRATFGDLSVVIPSGEQVEFDFIVDTSEVLASNTTTQTVTVDNCKTTLTNNVFEDDETLRVTSATCFKVGDTLVVSPDGTEMSSGGEERRILAIGNGVSTIDQLLTAAGFTVTFDEITGSDTAGATSGDCSTAVATTEDGYCGMSILAANQLYILNETAPFDATNGIATFDPTVAPANVDTDANLECPAYGGGYVEVAPTETSCTGAYNEPFDFSHAYSGSTKHVVGRVGRITYVNNGWSLGFAGTLNACFDVENSHNFSSGVGVTFTEDEATGAIVPATVTSATNNIICANFTYDGTEAAPYGFASGTIIKSAINGAVIRFRVTDFQADNVENGTDVTICEGVDVDGNDVLFGSSVDETAAPSEEDCDLIDNMTDTDATNYLCGAWLQLTNAGRLTVNINTNIYSDIITQNETSVPVLELRFAATDDKVEVTDIYLMNDLDLDGYARTTLTRAQAPFYSPHYPAGVYNSTTFACKDVDQYGNAGVGPSTDGSVTTFEGIDSLGDESQCSDSLASRNIVINEYAVGSVLKFELYNAAGQLIDTDTMTNGRLHFELGNASRIIVPKDGMTTVTVKVTVDPINNVANTGHALRLVLDERRADTQSGDPMYGLQAVTSATGLDLDPVENAAGNQFQPESNLISGYGSATGEVFVVHKTEFAVSHDTVQPPISAVAGASNYKPVYYFTVTPDASGPVNIKRLTFDITLDGFETICPFATGDHYDSDFAVVDTNPGAAGATCTAGNPAIVTIEEINGSTTPGTRPFSVGTVRVVDAGNGTGESWTQARLRVNFCKHNSVSEICEGGEYLSSKKTYGIFIANTVDTNPTQADERVTVNIVRDSLYSAPNLEDFQLFVGADPIASQAASTATADYAANIVWSDLAANLISIQTDRTTMDWMNGYQIEVDTIPQTNN